MVRLLSVLGMGSLLLVVACGSASNHAENDAGKEGGGGGPTDAGNCLKGATLSENWSINIGYSWTQSCGPGVAASFKETSSITASFHVNNYEVEFGSVTGSPTGGTQGLMACPVDGMQINTASPNGTPTPMTLTEVTGNFSTTTCEFTLFVTGEVTNQPAYILKSSDSSIDFKAGYSGYLQGTPIVLPAQNNASMRYGGTFGSTRSAVAVTIFDDGNGG
jgi:hypothetical protein